MTGLLPLGDGHAAIAAVREHRPDVLLLDIRMPRMNGIKAAAVVCAETACRVLMLTTFDQDDYVYDALHAGASGFLPKDVRRADLVHAVQVVASGESLLAPSVTRRLISDMVSKGPRRQPAPTGLDVLTVREKEPWNCSAAGSPTRRSPRVLSSASTP
ncbi:Response regulator receiver domain-containing protein [Streptosporangium subroseum]|uniref:Response regulator receiver domain-containing protein n=1 Tax=Streptosporangium subroseum TaxID=106412 RepID=A0A239NSX2_9ACTN|nr:response regulator transcription factor [Streptosporangium subroseum]SNT58021.1 Response regulator receiver domain-containing protein [Streptosporangium subroseum]